MANTYQPGRNPNSHMTYADMVQQRDADFRAAGGVKTYRSPVVRSAPPPTNQAAPAPAVAQVAPNAAPRAVPPATPTTGVRRSALTNDASVEDKLADNALGAHLGADGLPARWNVPTQIEGRDVSTSGRLFAQPTPAVAAPAPVAAAAETQEESEARLDSAELEDQPLPRIFTPPSLQTPVRRAMGGAGGNWAPQPEQPVTRGLRDLAKTSTTPDADQPVTRGLQGLSPAPQPYTFEPDSIYRHGVNAPARVPRFDDQATSGFGQVPLIDKQIPVRRAVPIINLLGGAGGNWAQPSVPQPSTPWGAIQSVVRKVAAIPNRLADYARNDAAARARARAPNLPSADAVQSRIPAGSIQPPRTESRRIGFSSRPATAGFPAASSPQPHGLLSRNPYTRRVFGD